MTTSGRAAYPEAHAWHEAARRQPWYTPQPGGVMRKWIWSFGHGEADADGTAKIGELGGGLAAMTRMMLPVPPGFTLAADACTATSAAGNWPEGLVDELSAAVARLESTSERRLGDRQAPLLVSVRSGNDAAGSGSAVDTVLNLGLNHVTVHGLAALSGDARFAWDSYRRFVQLFGDMVLGIHYTRFQRAQEEKFGARAPEELDAAELEALLGAFMAVIAENGQSFPQDPHEQLRLAIGALFQGYDSHRARWHRKANGIADDVGLPVTVQAMVFGNLGSDSGTGLCWTRDPKNGAPGLIGEWLANAQGEEVVRGNREVAPLDGADGSLASSIPGARATLGDVCARLEHQLRDVQEVEFTVERGRLWVLQTRTAPRSPVAAVRAVVDLVHEGVIERGDAIRRIDPSKLELVLRPTIHPDARRKVIAKGLDASPGAATGRVVFDSRDVMAMAVDHDPVVLVRLETTPEDIQGLTVAVGVLAARGGQTSHAAVVARGLGKPAVVGCSEIQVDAARELFYAGDTVVRKGDWITIDGSTGEVMAGKVEMVAPDLASGALSELLGWADEVARLEVRANADTGRDAARARELGARGVGLCRTEHMFFQADALRAIRRMILADDPRSRQLALNDILPLQRTMFREIFEVMEGLPVVVRLLDPPLHEFLPDRDEDVGDIARDLGVSVAALQSRIGQLSEVNPMMGLRGVRVGLLTPEVYRTQVRALFEAVCEMARNGKRVLPEVMIPFVALPAELERMRILVVDTAEQVIAEYGSRGRGRPAVTYRIGTMVEVPRAALLADRIAAHADFISFGTNDLTQLVWGMSRDDQGRFIPAYLREGLLEASPLIRFDVDGVGQLVEIGARRGREGRPGLGLGVCGEHAGDARGVAFFHKVGLDYVSCSPYRVPVARLAAAHAALGLVTAG